MCSFSKNYRRLAGYNEFPNFTGFQGLGREGCQILWVLKSICKNEMKSANAKVEMPLKVNHLSVRVRPAAWIIACVTGAAQQTRDAENEICRDLVILGRFSGFSVDSILRQTLSINCLSNGFCVKQRLHFECSTNKKRHLILIDFVYFEEVTGIESETEAARRFWRYGEILPCWAKMAS